MNTPFEDWEQESAGEETLSPGGETDLKADSEKPTGIEDWTLAELIGQFWRAPGVTWAVFREVLRATDEDKERMARFVRPPAQRRDPAISGVRQDVLAPLRAFRPFFEAPAAPLTLEETQARQREAAAFVLRIAALLVGLYGSSILAAERVEQYGLHVGAPYLLVGFLLWLASELYLSWPSLQKWWAARGSRPTAPPTADETLGVPEENGINLRVRLVLGAAGLAFSIMTGVFTSDNVFRLEGVMAWFISIGLWVAAFAPAGWGFQRIWEWVRRVRIRSNATFLALAAIMLVGTFFRVNELSRIPPEMTSDHVEKLLDAQRILNGNPQVFFPNNGGREPFQMYAMALFSRLPGLGMDFDSLKLLSALEGVLTLPVLWWMGREVIGRDKPKLGSLAGLALAALVAVSYWHTALSRLGLRIVLTPLVAALLIIFLSRALRTNRRGDFILAGLVLGFGLYTYQAARMLPVVVVLGAALAVIFKARTWAERRRYVQHLAVLVVVAAVVFVPLLTFWMQFPNSFWMRTEGRLLGDNIILARDEAGQLVERQATLQERLDAFRANLPVLMDNIRSALLMYNWKGDVLWFNGVPNRAAMDTFTGTLLVVGLAAWLARMVRRRDVVDWLLPLMLFVMLLPSAFSIAYPIENPSATRTSGTLPEAYLFAALPLAMLVGAAARLLPKRGMIVGGGLAALVLFGAASSNYRSYFTDYYLAYFESSPAPYSEAGAYLRGFAQSGGGFGNAFMLAYPYWWDHRAVGIEAGVLDWPGGIVDPDGDAGDQSAADGVPRFLYLLSQTGGRYRFDPDKDILFFYSIEDIKSERRLQELFPTGYWQIVYSAKPRDDFKVFRVPALGREAFIDFVVRNGAAG
jgi:hypothetical protein